jgi:hypothetical protein
VAELDLGERAARALAALALRRGRRRGRGADRGEVGREERGRLEGALEDAEDVGGGEVYGLVDRWELGVSDDVCGL